jgi:hypothetical protein
MKMSFIAKNFVPGDRPVFTGHSAAKVLDLKRPGEFIVANLLIGPRIAR